MATSGERTAAGWYASMNWPAAILIGLATLALGAVIGFAVGKNRPVELQLKAGDRTASLSIGGDNAVDYEQVLAMFFEPKNDWLRGAAKTWLKDKHEIVSIYESQLAALLEDKACKEFRVAVNRPAQNSVEYFADLENRAKCAGLPNVNALRSLTKDGRPPFHNVREVLVATVPEPGALPNKETVNICQSQRELDNVKIELVSVNRVDPQKVTPLVRLARARMNCGEQSFTAMHLRPEDARALTGEQKPNMPVHVYYSRIPPG
jgi:hypothetical protein